MATILTPPEQRVLLRNIGWETYEGLLAEHQDKSGPRFTYDRGLLEIMSPSFEHEEMKEFVASLVSTWMGELGVSIRIFGSATFRRKDLASGFEPDGCFYIQSAKHIAGKRRPDLAQDPPPDLVVEIDITNSSIDKLSLLAKLGIPEVWLYSNRMAILRLNGQSYSQVDQSVALLGLTANDLNEILEESTSTDRLDWLQRIRDRARPAK